MENSSWFFFRFLLNRIRTLQLECSFFTCMLMFMDEYSKVNSPGYKVVYAVLLIYDLMTFVVTRVYPPSRAASRHVELVLRLQLSVSLQSFCLQTGFSTLVCSRLSRAMLLTPWACATGSTCSTGWCPGWRRLRHAPATPCTWLTPRWEAFPPESSILSGGPI